MLVAEKKTHRSDPLPSRYIYIHIYTPHIRRSSAPAPTPRKHESEKAREPESQKARKPGHLEQKLCETDTPTTMADTDVHTPRRDDFEPDGVPNTGATLRHEAPAVSSSSALARFEFESGRGNDGTKILMVEWADDGQGHTGDWEVSWEGKSTVLSAKDGAEGKLHRLYFLLAPGASIPPIVKLEQRGGQSMQTNPLPAIFPPALGVSATTAGKKGVLHTVWAKKRLSVLQREIEQEMANGEGVGLEMAVQEKAWIEDNFGVGAKIASETSPASPKSPGGSRLSERLKGLKLGTSVSELSPSSGKP